MKKQTKTIDKTVVIFRKKVATNLYPLTFVDIHWRPRVVIKVFYRTVPAVSYQDIIGMIMNDRLKIDTASHWKLPNTKHNRGYLNKKWQPISVTRTMYRPGKGTTVMKQLIGDV